jgi:hypothetical protein
MYKIWLHIQNSISISNSHGHYDANKKYIYIDLFCEAAAVETPVLHDHLKAQG